MDLTLPEINLEEINKETSSRNAKQIYQMKIQQKKKFTETISTTTSF